MLPTPIKIDPRPITDPRVMTLFPLLDMLGVENNGLEILLMSIYVASPLWKAFTLFSTRLFIAASVSTLFVSLVSSAIAETA